MNDSQNIVEFPCPGCSSQLRVPSSIVGQQAKCPKCNEVVTVERPPLSAQPVPAAPVAPVQQAAPVVAPAPAVASTPPVSPIGDVRLPQESSTTPPTPSASSSLFGEAIPTPSSKLGNPNTAPGEDTEIRRLYRKMTSEIAKLYVGQDELVLGTLIALFSGGHVLIESVPGLGKTLFVRTLGKILGCQFGRIQFTADLMPSDITGAPIFNMKTQEFDFRPGPIFTQLLLADEINRSPAKAHAALLEIMQEQNITVDGTTHELEPPFCVMATQNPIESEGTYNLPEAQLDRFMFKLVADYPSEEQEAQILAMHGKQDDVDDRIRDEIETVTSPEEIVKTIRATAEVRVDESLVGYINKIVRLTRRWPQFYMGASPRAGISLIQGARALAAFYGRDYAVPDDVVQIALPALRHRVMLTAEAEVEGQSIDQIIMDLIRTIEVPRIDP